MNISNIKVVEKLPRDKILFYFQLLPQMYKTYKIN